MMCLMEDTLESIWPGGSEGNTDRVEGFFLRRVKERQDFGEMGPDYREESPTFKMWMKTSKLRGKKLKLQTKVLKQQTTLNGN